MTGTAPQGVEATAPASRRELRGTLEERLKHSLVPAPLYIRYRLWKVRRKGEAEFDLLPLLVDRTRNAVDVGANKGVYSYALSRLCRHVHAFEPYGKMRRILERTARRNVTVSPLALSDRTGSASFLVPRMHGGKLSNQGGSLSTAKVEGAHVALPVETARLDDLGLADVGFMKIDVEGSELAVIAGAKALLARDRPTLLIEIEERHSKVPLADAVAQVEAQGYRAYFLDPRRRSLSPFSQLRPETHSRPGSADYVFNFVFLPR